MQNTEFTYPQRRSEFWQTMYKPSLCTSLCWKSALYKMSKKIKKKIVRKITYVSEGPEVTLRNMWGHKNSDVCKHMPPETEKPPLTMIDEKPTDGTSTSKKDQDVHGMMKSENFLKGVLYIHFPNPDDELKNFFVKMVMEW